MYVSNRGGMTAAQFVKSDFWMHHNTRINQGHLIRSTCLQQTADNFIFSAVLWLSLIGKDLAHC